MEFGWKRMIPAALVWLMIVAGFQVTHNVSGSGFSHGVAEREYGFAAIGAAILLGLLLWRAIQVGRGATEVEGTRDDRLASREVEP
jgi:hypothetical protein